MKKYIFVLSLFVGGVFSLSAVANTAESTVPDPFKGFDANSKMVISYVDLDSLLEAVVLNTGRSDRKKASPYQSSTGTRMKISINRATVNEGNRFFFEIFENNQTNQQTIQGIRKRLESLPSATPLEKFSRNEQLAYWLNLYNVTILDEIVSVYPERELEDLLVGKKSILTKKLLTVAGIPLSLNDIEFTILRLNYNNDPLVIYGLYQGIIGGPNIRKNAYTGKYVYGDLIDNAMEFINSNRGTEAKSKRTFRVSSLYARNTLFFADFDADLSAHLQTYLEGEELSGLKAASKIKADINDWTITDLYGSGRDLGGSLASSNAALVGAVQGANSSRLASKAAASTRYSPAVLEHLNELNDKKTGSATGVVTIEELGQAPDEAATTASENQDGK